MDFACDVPCRLHCDTINSWIVVLTRKASIRVCLISFGVVFPQLWYLRMSWHTRTNTAKYSSALEADLNSPRNNPGCGNRQDGTAQSANKQTNKQTKPKRGGRLQVDIDAREKFSLNIRPVHLGTWPARQPGLRC